MRIIGNYSLPWPMCRGIFLAKVAISPWFLQGTAIGTSSNGSPLPTKKCRKAESTHCVTANSGNLVLDGATLS
jgi:hypothetical protein